MEMARAELNGKEYKQGDFPINVQRGAGRQRGQGNNSRQKISKEYKQEEKEYGYQSTYEKNIYN